MSLTQNLSRGILRSPAVAALTSPHGVDRYLEIVNPMWAVNEVRARVVGVHQETGDVTTLTLHPTSTWRGFRAGQKVLLGVEIDGARRTRCFSISSAQTSTAENEGRDDFTITVRAHDEGLVSKHLAHRAEPGLVVHLSQAEGEFTLPANLPDRLLMISGGSGITPLMSMLRTLVENGYDGRVTFLHYSQSPEQTIFADELVEIAEGQDNIDLAVVHTRHGGARFSEERLKTLAPDYAAIDTFACGPVGLIEQVQEIYKDSNRLKVEYFKTSTISADPNDATGNVLFATSQKQAENTGGTLLEQAEALGLAPAFGCRMGICFTCTSRKTEGTIRNVVTGAESSLPDEDIQICVSTPVGDCAVAL